MATRTRAQVATPFDGAILIEWLGMTQAGLDVGEPYIMPPGFDYSVMAFGTWGAGGVVTLEQSLESGTPANWQPCHDVTNTVATLADTSGNRMKQLLDVTYQFRPRISAGDGTTNLAVRLLGARK